MFMKFDPRTGMFKKQIRQFVIVNDFDSHLIIWRLLESYGDYIKNSIAAKSKSKTIVSYLHEATGLSHKFLYDCVNYYKNNKEPDLTNKSVSIVNRNKFDMHIVMWKVLESHGNYIYEQIKACRTSKYIAILLHKKTGIKHAVLHQCISYYRKSLYAKNTEVLSAYGKPRIRVQV